MRWQQSLCCGTIFTCKDTTFFRSDNGTSTGVHLSEELGPCSGVDWCMFTIIMLNCCKTSILVSIYQCDVVTSPDVPTQLSSIKHSWCCSSKLALHCDSRCHWSASNQNSNCADTNFLWPSLSSIECWSRNVSLQDSLIIVDCIKNCWLNFSFSIVVTLLTLDAVDLIEEHEKCECLDILLDCRSVSSLDPSRVVFRFELIFLKAVVKSFKHGFSCGLACFATV